MMQLLPSRRVTAFSMAAAPGSWGAREAEMEGTSFSDFTEICASVRTSRSGASGGSTWWWITGNGQSVRCI